MPSVRLPSHISPRPAAGLLAAQGTWVYGKRHGNGSYTYHDGGKYDGEWVDDKVRSHPRRGVASMANEQRRAGTARR